MTLIEIFQLPPQNNGKFVRVMGFKASYDNLVEVLGFKPSGPNSQEYDQQHQAGVIFGFKDETGREAWIWLDDKVPLGLTSTIHSWAAAGDIVLLSEVLPAKLTSGKVSLEHPEDIEYGTEN